MSPTGMDQPHDSASCDETGGRTSQAIDMMDVAPLGGPDVNPPGPAVVIPRAVAQLSCIYCRRKKLKCNRALPVCARCETLKEDCTYPASKQHNSGRRRQVKGLTDKPGQLEEQITQTGARSVRRFVPEPMRTTTDSGAGDTFTGSDEVQNVDDEVRSGSAGAVDGFYSAGDEPLIDRPHIALKPSRELLEELTVTYFVRLHHAAPMLHRARYAQSLQLSSDLQPPACLQYAVAASGAWVSTTHRSLAVPLYQQARALAEADETKGNTECFLTLAHAQCWLLLSSFEARRATFMRAAMSLGRAVRIAQMLQLHRQDRGDPNYSLAAPTEAAPMSQVETEERRRTWWVAFAADRLVAATTSVPALINAQEITIALPASEEAFEAGHPEQTSTLRQALRQKTVLCSSLAARVLVSHLLHQALMLAQNSTSSVNEEEEDAVSRYWSRYRQLDNDLTSIFFMLPDSLRLPDAFRCQHAVFANILAHVAIICLHQSAIRRVQTEADQDDQPDSGTSGGNPSAVATTVRQSRDRMLSAAKEIQHIFGIVQDLEMALRNPMQDFAAYTAALVFLERLAADHGDAASKSSVDFLLNVLNIAGQTNPSAKVFAARLTADLEGLSISVASSAGSVKS